MTNPTPTPDLDALREADKRQELVDTIHGQWWPDISSAIDQFRAAVEARVRAQAARAEVERLREAALELADAYDQWEQSACTFLHKHPHEPSDLVQNVRRAALRSTEEAE